MKVEGVEGVAAAEIEAVSGVIPESELDAYWAALSAHNFGAVRPCSRVPARASLLATPAYCGCLRLLLAPD